ncbi:MAG: helix-turn-helix transcriptional regulator [Candidatus Nitrospinota bacterium M3_3B_026]
MKSGPGKSFVPQGKIREVIDFVESVPLPAAALSGSGEIIHANRKISPPFPGSETESGLADFSFGAAERSSGQRLLAAVRMPYYPYPMVLLYSDERGGARAYNEEVVAGLLRLASPGGRAATAAEPGGDLLPVRLREAAESVLGSPELSGAAVENRVSDEGALSAASPLVVKRMILRTLRELWRLGPRGSIVVCDKALAEPGAGKTARVLSLQADVRRCRGKSGASEITAMGLRLKIFHHNLMTAVGLGLNLPVILRDGDSVEVQLSFPDRMESASTTGEKNQPEGETLSAREREIVEMVRAGFDNAAISERLGISTATVKQHLKAVYRKTGVKSRVELIFKLTN